MVVQVTGEVRSRKLLIDRLLAEDEEKRLRGFIFELFFEETICPAIAKLSGSDGFSTGWIKGYYRNKKCYLLVLNADRESDVDSVFSKKVAQRGSLVFFLLPVLRDGEVIRYSSHERSPHNANDISDIINKYLRAHKSEPKVKDPDLIRSIGALSTKHLMRILNSRMVMNSGCLSRVTDLDAVFLKNLGEITVCEFKRKYPAAGYRKLRSAIVDRDALLKCVESLQEGESSLGGEFVYEPCYGLDLSHVRNALDTWEVGGKYLYAILNGKASVPEMYFDERFNPNREIYIHFLLLNHDSCTGVSCTKGEDSGSFSWRRRPQLTILQSEFNKKFRLHSVPGF